ncbi:MAG TPA: alpha/beta fold hydrolase [Pseudonocardiaceae bacterium]|nr:alpha/beta fold hydrolase [Pseudonocardiaceae bacterium]
MPTVDVSGLRMYYEPHGDGPPVVLILGLGGAVAEFGVLIDALAQHHRVLAFDNRGVGGTGRPDTPYTIEMMADDTIGLMSAVGFDRAHVIGISMGGRIALALTLRRPEMVDRLVLVSTGARVIRNVRRRFVMGVLSRIMPGRGPNSQPRSAFQRQLAASGGWHGTDRLPEISVPTVILHGRQDRIAQYELAEELRDGIPGAKLVTFRGGHMFLMMGERQRFLDEVTAFLAG